MKNGWCFGLHSQKPDEFYEILRRRTPAPRIDIFARRRHFGFDAHGNQVENDGYYHIMTRKKSENSMMDLLFSTQTGNMVCR